jgi:biopolymer transport protein ExbB/TolQ
MLSTIGQAFVAGGSFMWVILGVLAVAVAVMVERTLYYGLYCRGNGAQLGEWVSAALRSHDIARARELLAKRKAPLFSLLRVAVERHAAGGDYEAVRESVEEAAIAQLPRLTRRLNYLALFANIATLLGLLGTIAGLQTSFGSLASTDAAQKATLLAQGISVAMNTTAFGLIVAVPCMVMYTLFNNVQQKLTNDIDEALVRVTNSVKARSV